MAKNNEKIKELLTQIENGTKDIFESNRYREYLSTMSKFHTYSFRNSLLIFLQKPEATHVAGYTTWQKKFNRQVQRGEKGIRIIGYGSKKINIEKEKKDEAGKNIIDKNSNVEKEFVTQKVPYFMPVYVYDVTQTSGEPLPKLVNELSGNVESYQNLIQAIQKASPFPIFIEDIKGNAKGYCDPKSQKIAIQKGMSEVQSIKTAIHEVTHADLHTPEVNLSLNNRIDRRTMEVEAESTAFVVCSHYGIDTSEYTFPYLAAWSSTKELSELKNSLETIQNHACELIDKIDTHLFELENNRENTLKNRQKQEETLNSVKFDNDIDLDREKTREQRGFKKISMKERMAAAQSEAERRNELHTKKQTKERGEI